MQTLFVFFKRVQTNLYFCTTSSLSCTIQLCRVLEVWGLQVYKWVALVQETSSDIEQNLGFNLEKQAAAWRVNFRRFQRSMAWLSVARSLSRFSFLPLSAVHETVTCSGSCRGFLLGTYTEFDARGIQTGKPQKLLLPCIYSVMFCFQTKSFAKRQDAQLHNPLQKKTCRFVYPDHKNTRGLGDHKLEVVIKDLVGLKKHCLANPLIMYLKPAKWRRKTLVVFAKPHNKAIVFSSNVTYVLSTM